MIARALLGSSRRARGDRRRLRTQRGPGPNEWLEDHRPCYYWVATRRPFPSLHFLTPRVVRPVRGGPRAGLWHGGRRPEDRRRCLVSPGPGRVRTGGPLVPALAAGGDPDGLAGRAVA